MSADEPTIMRPILCALVTVVCSVSPDSAFIETGQRGPRLFGPGVCGPADPSAINTATETGGQPFFLSPTEAAKSAAIMSASFLQSELILWATGEGERTYSVPVDSSIERATFSVSFDTKGGTLTVLSPEGAVVRQGDRIVDTVLNCVRSITVAAPTAGIWRVNVMPTGRFWLVTRSKSELSLMTAEFVRRGGRPGHEGLFRIQGRPIAGRPAMLRVRLSSDVRTVTFGLVSLDAQVLQDLNLNPVDDNEFVGSVNLPSVPFRVVATGLTNAGSPYQRLFPTLFRAELIEVLPPDKDTVVAGSENPITFVVRNHGSSARLNLVAVDDAGKVLPAEPSILELDKGMEGTSTVRLKVPARGSSETSVRITLTASLDDDSLRLNSAMKEFIVIQR